MRDQISPFLFLSWTAKKMERGGNIYWLLQFYPCFHFLHML